METGSILRHRSYAIRLGPSMQQQAAEIAERAGVSLNYFICQAINEKLAREESFSYDEQPFDHEHQRRVF